MNRTGLLASVALMVIAVSASMGSLAWSQANLRVLHDHNAILQQQDIARQNALAAQAETTAARNHQDAQLALRPLDARPSSPSSLSELNLRPSLSATPPRGSDASDDAVQAERMDRLTDERLAQSNARLRALTPAQ